MTIVFNGVEYEIQRVDDDGTYVYTQEGVFTVALVPGSDGLESYVMCPTTGPDTVTIEAYTEAPAPSPTAGGLKVTITSEDVGTGIVYIMDKFAKSIFTTLESGIMPLFVMSDNEDGFDIKNLTNYGYEINSGIYSFEIEGIQKSFLSYRDNNYPTTGSGK